ncbi:MAG TPA: flavoprotein [Pseudobdellovibrionaceae bacterium]|nr:flavoprotein [Pseudobdellovibrionaceae bacterium]
MLKFENRPPRILLMMSGSIAAFKVVQLISTLIKPPHSAEVEVVRTSSVEKFIGDASLEGLTGRPVRHSLWQSGQAMAHIHLVRWADLIVVAPCTANTLNRMAQGLGEDLLTTLFLAHDFSKPWLIAPAMNTSMYHHPTTQASLRRLSEMGCEILPTGHGDLACGEVGEGRLLEADQLLEHILRHLPRAQSKSATTKKVGAGLRILITAGGTRVPLDDVRDLRWQAAALDAEPNVGPKDHRASEAAAFATLPLPNSSQHGTQIVLGNSSTGRTGVQLAEALFDRGHQITLLASSSAPTAARSLTTHRFDTFEDLQTELKHQLQSRDFDLILHAAAVSDWLPEQIQQGKVDSRADRWTIHFKPAPKLIAQLQAWSKNPDVKIIGFKLTSRASRRTQEEKIQQVLAHPGVEAVIANELTEWPLWSFNTNDSRIEIQSREQMPDVIDTWIRDLGQSRLTQAPEVQV